MRSSIRPFSREIKNFVKEEPQSRIRQAYLVNPYNGFAREVLIQLSDPSLGRGVIVRATIKPGISSSPLVPNSPVSVICTHGHYEVIA